MEIKENKQKKDLRLCIKNSARHKKEELSSLKYNTIIFKVLKEKNWQPRILYPPKVLYKNEGEIKIIFK